MPQGAPHPGEQAQASPGGGKLSAQLTDEGEKESKTPHPSRLRRATFSS